MDFVFSKKKPPELPEEVLQNAAKYDTLTPVSDPEGTPQRRTDASPLMKPQNISKGGGEMVTYEGLFVYTTVLIQTITLVVLILKNNK